MIRISHITILSDLYCILYETSGFYNQINATNYTLGFRNKYKHCVLAFGINMNPSNMKDGSLILFLRETLKFNPNACLLHPIFCAPYCLFKKKVKYVFQGIFNEYILQILPVASDSVLIKRTYITILTC